MTRPAFIAALMLGCLGGAAGAGDFAREHYTVSLADVCPDPLVIQKDWLMQAEQGPLVQLIGAGGEMSAGAYSGPLGATGIELQLLEGGGGIGLGDGETAYSALFMGNSRAGTMPHLAFQELDNAFIFSARFPTVGVFAPLDIAPTALMWDAGTYPDGFHSIADLQGFAASGAGRIYIATTKRTYGRYLLEAGVPAEAFIEGYRGDLENFVVNNGTWLQAGFVTSEAYKLEHGANWARPIGSVTLNELGYPNYTGMISVAASRLDELAPCLERLVPVLQQAAADYIADPAEVNAVIVAFNEAGMGASWWRTPPDLTEAATRTMRAAGMIGNGPDDTIGDFDMGRVAALLDLIRDDLDERADPGVAPGDVVTNRFIDPAIGLK